MAIQFLNTVAVDTNVLYVDTANDRVGIGVTNPSSFFNQARNLVVGGSGNVGATIYSSSSGNTFLAFADVADGANSGFNAGGSIYYEHANDAMVTRVNGSERMRINSSGNVGIGTSSPTAKTDIRTSASSGGTSSPTFRAFGYDTDSYFEVNNNANNSANIKLTRSDAATVFSIDGHSGTTFFNGNVGIGTSSPNTALEVDGAISTTTSDYVQGSTGSRLLLETSGSGNTHSYIQAQNAGGTSSNEDLALQLYGGSVGIGTASPGYKLEVNGTLGLTGYIYHVGDSNSYFGFPINDTIIAATAGSERMRIGSAGQIGIGGANYGTSGQVLTSNGSSSAPSWQTPSAGDITGVTAGSYMTGGGTSGTVTLNANASVNATANTLAARTSSGDIYARLLRATYPNQSTISGAIAFRVNNGTDNYTRYCSSPAAIRSFIGAGTGSGDITSVTAGAYLSGGATSGNATVNLDVGGSGNWWGKGAAVGGDGVMEVGKYIDFHDTNTATNDFDYRLTSSGGRLYLSGDLEVDGGDIYINDNNTRITEGANNSVRIQTNSGYVDIGPANSSYSHFYTDRGQYYFNKGLTVDTGQVRSYNEDLNLNRAGSTTARLRITSGTTISDQALQSASTVRSQFNSGDYAQLESNGSGGVIKAVSSTSTTVLFRSYGDSYILNDLGIGTSSPSARLHVESTTSTTSSNILRLKSLTASSGPFIRMIDFVRSNNSTRGYIAMNPYSVQYNSTSDYRLKRNVTPMENSIDRIKLLKPSRFNWVEGPDDYVVDGFIAHEVQDVVHDAVSGEKDAVDENNEPAYQGIDQSKLVPLLTAALQDAITKIEQLETRIQTLEDN